MSSRFFVFAGIVLAFAALGLWLTFVPGWFHNLQSDASTADRLSLGIVWAAVLQLPLIVGIATVAQQRFWSDKYADGSDPQPGSALEINRRYLTNTVEQTLLATVGLMALSITLPITQTSFIPALSLLFVFGRLCFWLGYLANPYARAFGIVLTFLPIVAMYAYILRALFSSFV